MQGTFLRTIKAISGIFFSVAPRSCSTETNTTIYIMNFKKQSCWTPSTPYSIYFHLYLLIFLFWYTIFHKPLTRKNPTARRAARRLPASEVMIQDLSHEITPWRLSLLAPTTSLSLSFLFFLLLFFCLVVVVFLLGGRFKGAEQESQHFFLNEVLSPEKQEVKRGSIEDFIIDFTLQTNVVNAERKNVL